MTTVGTTAPEKPLDRGNILWMLAALTLCVAPHFVRLPIWASIVVVASFGWRLDLTLSARRKPGGRLSTLLAIASTLATFLSYKSFFGRDAGVTLLVLMLALKLIELRHARDAMFVLFLGLFALLANFLYVQTATMGGYTLLAVWITVAALIGFARSGRPATPVERLRPAAALLAQSLPVAVILFVIFPRLSGPLWGEGEHSHAGSLGMSESMSPGSLGDIRPSALVALVAHFYDVVPPPAQRYWRGVVLWDYDHGIWRSGPPQFDSATRPVAHDKRRGSRYTVVLEPHGGPWMIALDLPGEVPSGARMTADHTLRAAHAVRDRIDYTLTSYPATAADEATDDSGFARALRLPPHDNPRSRALAERWRAEGLAPEELVRRALHFFRSEAFYYTLTPPTLQDMPVDEFLFETRAGFCEHFAGAFTYLMRAAGVPARVVLGYQGGEPTADGHLLVVRQSDAHAWAEVWIAKKGWVRIDPTAAVAPLRVERGFEAALGGYSQFDALGFTQGASFMRSIDDQWRSINVAWNHWVLGYGQDRQRSVLAKLGIEPGGALRVGLLALVGCALALSIVVLIQSRVARERNPDRVKREYDRLCAKLARRGAVRAQHEGPSDFARRASAALPHAAAEIARLTEIYVGLRYGKVEPENWRAFRNGVRAFRA